ncbi:hypothetical protein HER32_12250 [Hymenobacter sp. BT18]|uniref:hypothetical protein n=1 Tax=Hymenobacter sp. BT18 TaxID=2835648 RepID=UPI00143E5FA1|nr:hypothetical protein [Hymenobacter sp. BT18]QIX61912.1 hypothetical protein HER32_12250 [Hymenobacter sp. BT18]
MNDKQRAKLAMLQATLGVLTKHASLYLPNKALTAARVRLAELVADLDPTAATQQAVGAAAKPGAVKQKTKALLATRAAETAAALLAYADEIQDIRLHTDADYTERQLLRATDNDLPRIAKNIHTRATELLTPLKEQGVTQQELTDLAAALTAFQQEQAKPRVTVADAKAQSTALRADLRAATALLRNRIDKYLVRYQRPQPEFYTAYLSARQSINTAARKEKPPPPSPRGSLLPVAPYPFTLYYCNSRARLPTREVGRCVV